VSDPTGLAGLDRVEAKANNLISDFKMLLDNSYSGYQAADLIRIHTKV
jgi:hypothetical protein